MIKYDEKIINGLKRVGEWRFFDFNCILEVHIRYNPMMMLWKRFIALFMSRFS